MKPAKNILLVLLLAMVSTHGFSQLNVTDGNTQPYNPSNLVRSVFLGSGVEVTGVQYIGDQRSVGYFEGGTDQIDLERGIVLSTGFAKSIVNPNTLLNDNGDVIPGTSFQDPDLQNIAADIIDDVAMYVIKFIPAADTLRFRYTFASEEYPTFICDINDAFGFFISGPNPQGGMYNSQNIAIIPDPSDPSGLTFTNIPVSINTVHGGDASCPAQFPEYYNEVPLGADFFEMNAYLDVFTAEAIVVPCEEYTIKLGVADASDNLLNSAVFLEAKSFGTGTLKVNLNSLSVDGSLAEGCGEGELEFTLPRRVDNDFELDFEILNPPNSATPGIDYPEFPDQLIIPAGSSAVTVPLQAFLDGEDEGDEVIQFALQVDLCNRDTFTIVLRDDELLAPILPDDITICEGDELTIPAKLDPSFTLPPAPFFEATNLQGLIPNDGVITSTIQVSGVIPTTLKPGVIESICITGAEHRALNDFDIFLISPGGQLLELTTDNGFKPNNFADVDSFKNTCFTPDATININNGENILGPIFSNNPRYTGDFLPEGVWSDLWADSYPTNGDWQLIVIDDEGNFDGTLEGWSITFASFYDVTYEWSSIPGGIICDDCDSIVVAPTFPTEYTLRIIDSYGCDRSASMAVDVVEGPNAPLVQCIGADQNSVEVGWLGVPNAVSYEVRIDGGSWIPINMENYEFQGLPSSTDFTIEVRTVGLACASTPRSVTCRTLDCIQPAVTLTIDEVVSCADNPNGKVTISATGIAPFIYKLNESTNTDGIFNTAKVGTNSYSVEDATGCIFASTFQMNGPDSIKLTNTFTYGDPCNLVNDITGSVLVQGGTQPYSYNWSTGSTDATASNLSPGVYFITISDNNGCDTVTSLEIPALPPFMWTVETEAPLCKGDASGIARINVVEGMGPFAIEWEDGSSNEENQSLASGSYVVTVTDALGCAESKLFTITDGPTIMVDITTTNPSCKGDSTGTAVAVVNGGLPPYSFIWSSGNSNTENNSNLPAGSYMLMVADANNCMATLDFEIEDPEGINYDAAITNNLCSGESNGQIEILDANSSGGAVSILWDNGSTLFERQDLINGTYCFTLSDGSTCSLDACVEVSSPERLLISPEISAPTCENTNDGSINIDVLGGTGPFIYQWQGPTPNLGTNAGINDLVAGSYDLTVTDGNNCVLMESFEVSAANPIVVDSSVFPITCKGSATGQILFSASGGNPPFQYNWIGPNGFVAQTNNIVDVFAGVYTVSFSDASGCSSMLTFEIEEPDLELEIDIIGTEFVCFEEENGQLNAEVSGGSAPYSILWSNGSTLNSINQLSAGSYGITVTDRLGCETTSMFQIMEQGQINIDITQNPASCFEAIDASAEITSISYGSQNVALDQFDFTWNTIPNQTGPTALNLQGGQTYILVAEDSRGCRGEQSVIVEQPEKVSAVVEELSQVSCFGGSDGRLDISGVGGNGGYRYQWSVGEDSMNQGIDSLARGSYSVTITDMNGCSGVKQFTIEEPLPLNLNFNKVEVNCFQGNDGRIEAEVTGGTIPYAYNWSNGEEGASIEQLVSDWYILTLTDVNGCVLIDSALVFEPDDPISVELETEDVICFEGSNGRISATASGGSGFYTYSIDGNTFTSNSVFPNLAAGNYQLYVKDFKGCQDTFSDVFIFQPDEPIVDLGEDLVIPFGTSTQFFPIIENLSGDIRYIWRSGNIDLLSCNTCLNPIFDGQKESTFELFAEDENGCQASDVFTVRLENYSPLIVPTAFTPNDDGENDFLELFARGIRVLNSFVIYDRWGAEVYRLEDVEADDVNFSWDGTFRGDKAPTGLYYWFAEVEFDNGFTENFNGNTTLLR